MRFFLYGLLLLNVALFAWQLLSPELPEARLPAVDRGVEPLVLMSEKEHAANSPVPATEKPVIPVAESTPPRPKTVPRQAATPKPAVQKKAPPVCYQLTGLERRKEVDIALTGMQALGYATELKTDYKKGSKFLVYLPSYPSLAEARKVTAALEDKGVRDYQILALEGKKNSISLGVFSLHNIAEKRLLEISQLGYEPVLQPVSGKIRYRILFSKGDNSRLTDEEDRFLLNSFKNSTISTIKCR